MLADDDYQIIVAQFDWLVFGVHAKTVSKRFGSFAFEIIREKATKEKVGEKENFPNNSAFVRNLNAQSHAHKLAHANSIKCSKCHRFGGKSPTNHSQ